MLLLVCERMAQCTGQPYNRIVFFWGGEWAIDPLRAQVDNYFLSVITFWFRSMVPTARFPPRSKFSQQGHDKAVFCVTEGRLKRETVRLR